MQRLQHSFTRLAKEVSKRQVPVIDEYSRYGSTGPGFHHLQPISLSAMSINSVYPDRYVSGTLASHPCNVAGVTATIFHTGSNSVALLVNNALTGDDDHEAERLFPKGAKVVVKEPVYMSDYPFHGYGPCLWLSNPASLEVISYTNSENQRLEDCLTLASEQVSKELYEAGIELYTRYVNVRSSWFSHVEMAEVDGEFIDALAGRSESMVKLGRFHSALDDAEKALKLDSGHVRSVECKVKALWGLQRYGDAYSFVEQCGSPGAGSLRERALTLRNESTAGTHDLSEFFMQKESDEAAEYAGPVEIRMTSDGRGRGLFLTGDVRCGELLFVTNAVAEFEFDPGDLQSAEDLLSLRRKLFVKVLRACSSSSRARSQVYSMMELRTESEDGKDFEKAAPSMQTFIPNVEFEEESSWELDVARIWRIVQVGDDYGSDSWGTSYIGLWPLVTFLNNSCCCANVSTFKVGRAWYVYASRDMQRGSELFRSYIPSGGFESFAKRRHQLPFSCNCPRCILEQRLEEQLKPIDKLDEAVESGAAAVHLERLLKTCTVLGKLSWREKHWLRASYFESYFWYYGTVRFFPTRLQKFSWMPSMEGFLVSCHETRPGSPQVLKLILRWMEAQNEGAVEKIGDDLEELLHKELVAGYGLQNAAIRKS